MSVAMILENIENAVNTQLNSSLRGFRKSIDQTL